MITFLFACSPDDALDMTIMMEGMKAHSDAEAFPAWCDEEKPVPRMILDLLPKLGHLQDTWVITLPGLPELENLVLFMESVEWRGEIFITDITASKCWTPEQFHKAVMVDKEFV